MGRLPAGVNVTREYATYVTMHPSGHGAAPGLGYVTAAGATVFWPGGRVPNPDAGSAPTGPAQVTRVDRPSEAQVDEWMANINEAKVEEAARDRLRTHGNESPTDAQLGAAVRDERARLRGEAIDHLTTQNAVDRLHSDPTVRRWMQDSFRRAESGTSFDHVHTAEALHPRAQAFDVQSSGQVLPVGRLGADALAVGRLDSRAADLAVRYPDSLSGTVLNARGQPEFEGGREIVVGAQPHGTAADYEAAWEDHVQRVARNTGVPVEQLTNRDLPREGFTDLGGVVHVSPAAFERARAQATPDQHSGVAATPETRHPMPAAGSASHSPTGADVHPGMTVTSTGHPEPAHRATTPPPPRPTVASGNDDGTSRQTLAGLDGEHVVLARPKAADIGQGLSYRVVETKYGTPGANAARFAEFAHDYGVIIEVRPTTGAAPALLRDGSLPKPELLKDKTINLADTYLGARPDQVGRVGFFAPERPDMDRVPEALRGEVKDRYEQRLSDYEHHHADIQRARDVIFVHDRVIHDRATGRPFTGDHDIWNIRWADGRPMSRGDYEFLVKEMQFRRMGVEHGATVWWNVTHGPLTPANQRSLENMIANHSAGGKEPVLVFRPDGSITTAWHDPAHVPDPEGGAHNRLTGATEPQPLRGDHPRAQTRESLDGLSGHPELELDPRGAARVEAAFERRGELRPRSGDTLVGHSPTAQHGTDETRPGVPHRAEGIATAQPGSPHPASARPGGDAVGRPQPAGVSGPAPGAAHPGAPTGGRPQNASEGQAPEPAARPRPAGEPAAPGAGTAVRESTQANETVAGVRSSSRATSGEPAGGSGVEQQSQSAAGGHPEVDRAGAPATPHLERGGPTSAGHGSGDGGPGVLRGPSAVSAGVAGRRAALEGGSLGLNAAGEAVAGEINSWSSRNNLEVAIDRVMPELARYVNENRDAIRDLAREAPNGQVFMNLAVHGTSCTARLSTYTSNPATGAEQYSVSAQSVTFSLVRGPANERRSEYTPWQGLGTTTFNHRDFTHSVPIPRALIESAVAGADESDRATDPDRARMQAGVESIRAAANGFSDAVSHGFARGFADAFWRDSSTSAAQNPPVPGHGQGAEPGASGGGDTQAAASAGTPVAAAGQHGSQSQAISETARRSFAVALANENDAQFGGLARGWGMDQAQDALPGQGQDVINSGEPRATGGASPDMTISKGEAEGQAATPEKAGAGPSLSMGEAGGAAPDQPQADMTISLDEAQGRGASGTRDPESQPEPQQQDQPEPDHDQPPP